MGFRTPLLEVSPNSSFAFDIFVDYCKSEDINHECVAALAIVLTLPACIDCPLMLPRLKPPLIFDAARDQNEGCYRGLYDSLNSCITLSCCSEGIDSLLCSVFFEPTVPCNLLGAHLLGVTEAIEPFQSNP